jgi:hypothetical protein
VAVLGESPSGQRDKPLNPAVTSPEQIEADWLLQARIRGQRPAIRKNTPLSYHITPEQDAAGGCDGVKDGSWGFHTGLDERPWWQVDLGARMPLARIVIYNSGYSAEWKRLLGFTVLLSDDGQAWTHVFRHDGKEFEDPKQPIPVELKGAAARLVRIQLPGKQHLTLDEVEVYPVAGNENVALNRPANQSSSSKWSVLDYNPWSSQPVPQQPVVYPVTSVIGRGLKLADDLHRRGVDVNAQVTILKQVSRRFEDLPADAPEYVRRRLYLKASWAIRKMTLANPLLDFDKLLFAKRAPCVFNCHCDQYIAWWSRPGGELCILEDFTSDSPRVRSLTADLLPPGDIIRPDIFFDGTKVLFAYARYYPDLLGKENKLDKSSIPEDSFYHLYEMNLDGTRLRRLTRGKYNDFDGRYLPNGNIVFLSTRRGQFIQCGKSSAHSTNATEDLPDSFVRCGGDAFRPCSVHTLHVIDGDGGNMRSISPFESFEWTPSVAHDGRILYARWDYVDRHRMWHMGLWSTLPDGMAAQAVFGNFTRGPYSIFEARSIPDSDKFIFTASAHHSITGGSLVLLDIAKGVDGQASMTRLTPEVPFPEFEGWGNSYYANPLPLSEEHYLTAWSPDPLPIHATAPYPRLGNLGAPGPPNSLGLYLFDVFGNLNLIYRDPDISSMYPLPIRPRRRPAAVSSQVTWDGSQQEGRMLLHDVYHGDLDGSGCGSVRKLRIVGVPPKTDPRMNHPNLGVTHDDPGKFVLGTVPVDEDGSAYFRVPSGLPIFFQALNDEGMAIQTMRSVTYVQPGQTYACVGCHEHRQTAPPGKLPLAALREPSRIQLGPQGSWPLDFQVLVQPVLEKHCVRCHRPGAEGEGAKTSLVASAAYTTLLDFGGERSLRHHVQARYDARRSVAGACAAMSSPLVKLVAEGHYEVELEPAELERLIVWMDTYAQRTGSYSSEQEQQLRALQKRLAPLLAQNTTPK